MARRLIFRPSRLTVVLAIMAALFVALSVVAVIQGARFGPPPPTPSERALEQLQREIGPGAELRYVEAGADRSVCGYAGLKGRSETRVFVSRPRRILFGDDPLRVEFEAALAAACPGFARRAPAPTGSVSGQGTPASAS